jgi:hypothetical protein
MILAAAIICIILCVPAFDWAGMARLSVFCDLYEYWPLTRLRIASLVLLEAAAISAVLVPAHLRLWALLFVLIAAIAWLIVGLHDVFTQSDT